MTSNAKTGRILACGLLLVSVAACAGGGSGAPASANAEEAALRVADLAVELGAYQHKLQKGAQLAWEASVDTLTLQFGRELTGEEQARVKAIFENALGQYLSSDLWRDSVAAVYARHFTAEELDAMYAFYSSPVGRKSLELEAGLADEVDGRLETELVDKMDMFVEQVDAELDAAFPEIADEEGS